MAPESAPQRVLIVPGNGCGGDIRGFNFYGWADAALSDTPGFVPVLPGPFGMPDPNGADRKTWLAHIEGAMRCDAESVLVGHSSGAVAALRWAETRPIRGIVLVAAYDDALGDPGEQTSGYFDGPFDWAAIRENCGFIVQFAGVRDQLVPIHIQRRVAHFLAPKVVYVEVEEEDHFFEPPFHALVQQIVEGSDKLKKAEIS
ncbi:putative hydrolase rbbp9 [Gonapodya sp. JEL0774]|nr:putative hydrolase rbbp9 [Gonapodya sp. JEL0774]